MKSLIIKFLFTFSVFLFVSCNDSDSIVIGNRGGIFQGKIVLLDSLGTNPLEGTIKINQANSSDLKGSWNFKNGESGTLVGSINNMKVQLNLNPNYVDNNTILLGNFDGKTIKGQWYHSSFVGVDNKGTFFAVGY